MAGKSIAGMDKNAGKIIEIGFGLARGVRS
jgi:hypothetical protein